MGDHITGILIHSHNKNKSYQNGLSRPCAIAWVSSLSLGWLSAKIVAIWDHWASYDSSALLPGFCPCHHDCCTQQLDTHCPKFYDFVLISGTHHYQILQWMPLLCTQELCKSKRGAGLGKGSMNLQLPSENMLTQP